MSQKTEGTLINTIKNSTNELTMTGKPVLVQNNLGIFYGILERADTRKGTALLSNGYAISPERYITFVQFLNYVFDEVDEPDENSEIGYANGLMGGIRVVGSQALEGLKINTITDYATEGVQMVQRGSFEDSSVFREQLTSDIISLTGIYAIVPISEEATVRQSFNLSRHYIVHKLNDAMQQDIDEIGAIKIKDTFVPLKANNKIDMPDSGKDTRLRLTELVFDDSIGEGASHDATK